MDITKYFAIGEFVRLVLGYTGTNGSSYVGREKYEGHITRNDPEMIRIEGPSIRGGYIQINPQRWPEYKIQSKNACINTLTNFSVR